ncbi:serine acetyltransferase [Aurantibacter sp.]|uniref:serine acetyltransferase n=1 Tax=Aurantibacter sp. TaxID=2807103 RepID=UPI0032675CE9
MKRTIKKDLFRYNGQTSIRKGLKIDGFKYTYYLRMSSASKRISFKGAYYRFILKKLRYKYSIQIPIKTDIGEGLFIGHFGMIVINERAKIGKNCNIAHSVTIGQTNRGKRKGCPTIGNKVWIGTGSVIVGNISIGSNVLIAPNTYINSNIPDNSIVTGNPFVVIPRENATEDYINFFID